MSKRGEDKRATQTLLLLTPSVPFPGDDDREQVHWIRSEGHSHDADGADHDEQKLLCWNGNRRGKLPESVQSLLPLSCLGTWH